jgi:hypothetical protein
MCASSGLSLTRACITLYTLTQVNICQIIFIMLGVIETILAHTLHRMGRNTLCNSLDFAAGVWLPSMYCITILALHMWAINRDITFLIVTFLVGSFLAALMAGSCYRRRSRMRKREKRQLLKQLASFDFEATPMSEATNLLKAVFNCFDSDESGDLSRRELSDAINAIHQELTPAIIRSEMMNYPQIKSNNVSRNEFIEVIDEWNEHFRSVKRKLLMEALPSGSSGKRCPSLMFVTNMTGKRAKRLSKEHSISEEERRSDDHGETTERRGLYHQNSGDSFNTLRFRKAVNRMHLVKPANTMSPPRRLVRLISRGKRNRTIAPAVHATVLATTMSQRSRTSAPSDFEGDASTFASQESQHAYPEAVESAQSTLRPACVESPSSSPGKLRSVHFSED